VTDEEIRACIERGVVPKCPDCYSRVDRPKCLFELNPAHCPRHGIRHRWEKLRKEMRDE
jgi:NAD-dependent SIR2 family protein deacetylase